MPTLCQTSTSSADADGNAMQPRGTEMTSKLIATLLLFLACSGIATMWGVARAHSVDGVILDCRVTDLGARALLHHEDPYSEAAMVRVFEREEKNQPQAQQVGLLRERYLFALQVYPPTAELVLAPFALLPWQFTYVLWIGLTVISMTMAVFLMWQAAHPYSADLPFYLACIVLFNSGILFSGGNTAGLAVSLCVISVWCILQQRFAYIAIVCMVLSLSIKPHDSGLIWLYFLLLGGMYRKRALQSLAWIIPMGLVSVAWIWHVSPNWINELRSNIRQMSSGGMYNDPAGSVTPQMVHLQAALATFNSNPHVYNAVAYILWVPVFLVWLVLVLKRPRTRESIWIGLAAITALSLLPVYHRPYDAKMLVLTFPACAILWAKRGWAAWLAASLTAASVLVTSDFPIAALTMLKPEMPSTPDLGQKLHFMLAVHPASLILLITGIFYVWAFHRSPLVEEQQASETKKNSLHQVTNPA